jgi:hypothetical protein
MSSNPHTRHFKKGGIRPEGAGLPPQKISVFNLNTNKYTIYDSIRATSRALNIPMSTLYKYCNYKEKKTYKGVYIFEKIK